MARSTDSRALAALAALALGGCYLSHTIDEDAGVVGRGSDGGATCVPPDAGPLCAPGEPTIVLCASSRSFGGSGCRSIDVTTADEPGCAIGGVRHLRVVSTVGNDVQFDVTPTSVAMPGSLAGYVLFDAPGCDCRGAMGTGTARVGGDIMFGSIEPGPGFDVEVALLGSGITYHVEACALDVSP